MPTRLPKLAGLAEVAAIIGVSRKRAWQITRQDRKFPLAAQELAMGPVWLESDVLAYRNTQRPAQPDQEMEAAR